MQTVSLSQSSPKVRNRTSYLVIFPVDQSQFKLELCGINTQDPGSTLSVQAVHTVTLDTGDVDRKVQGTNDTVITEKQSVK